MECVVGHGAVSLGVGGVETRRGGSNAVAANKVAFGGGRRIQNCGAGASFVSHNLLLALHFVAFSNCLTCLRALERVRTIHIVWKLNGEDLGGAAGTDSEAV